ADIDGPGAQSAADEIGALGLQVDVANPLGVRRMVEAVVDAYGRVDVLVNNAALFSTLEYAPIEDIDVELWDRVMAVNVRGVFLCCQAVAPIMKKEGSGKIINIASGTLLSGVPNFLHYITSK